MIRYRICYPAAQLLWRLCLLTENFYLPLSMWLYNASGALEHYADTGEL
jgi:hypothetical protein